MGDIPKNKFLCYSQGYITEKWEKKIWKHSGQEEAWAELITPTASLILAPSPIDTHEQTFDATKHDFERKNCFIVGRKRVCWASCACNTLHFFQNIQIKIWGNYWIVFMISNFLYITNRCYGFGHFFPPKISKRRQLLLFVYWPYQKLSICKRLNCTTNTQNSYSSSSQISDKHRLLFVALQLQCWLLFATYLFITYDFVNPSE